MKDLRAHLRDGDPFRAEGGLSAIESARMRAVVVAAAPAQRLVPWRPLLAIAAGLVGVVTAGAWSVGQTSSASDSNTAVASDRATAESELGALRQVYFSTPGGTRVIWQFNQTFELR